ncbi:MAG TPA: DoxX family protein [Candidatus Limnocylindrales bacterium]|nr:DoxX family protein [Candidatus Limnocylindrales bacterium]
MILGPDLALLVLRVTVGAVVMAHGLMKLGWVGQGGSVAGVGGWFDSIGLKPGLLWAAVATFAEAAGGLLMVLGLGGPIGPGLVAADMLVVTVVAHWSQGFWVMGGKSGIEFPLPLVAGAFAVMVLGHGAWSLDAALGLTYPAAFLSAWAILMAAGAAAAILAWKVLSPKGRRLADHRIAVAAVVPARAHTSTSGGPLARSAMKGMDSDAALSFEIQLHTGDLGQADRQPRGPAKGCSDVHRVGRWKAPRVLVRVRHTRWVHAMGGPRQRVHGRGRAGDRQRRCAQLPTNDRSPDRRRNDGRPA